MRHLVPHKESHLASTGFPQRLQKRCRFTRLATSLQMLLKPCLQRLSCCVRGSPLVAAHLNTKHARSGTCIGAELSDLRTLRPRGSLDARTAGVCAVTVDLHFKCLGRSSISMVSEPTRH